MSALALAIYKAFGGKKGKRKRKRKKSSRLNDRGAVFQQLLTASQPGAKKMEFPYTIPVIKTEVELGAATQKTLVTTAAVIGTAVVINGISRVATAIINKK